MQKAYTEQELQMLHATLYEILGEIIRVCDVLNISFFVIGGTAIGCHFWKGIIPFDDDIDIGMTRKNYQRFLSEAPGILKKDYFLQWFGSEPHTPFYFAKVRKNHTLFVEEITEKIDMHQGIFIDVIPFDRIPNNEKAERRQRKLANLLTNSFVSKEIWQWKYFGHCDLPEPKSHSWLNCLMDRLAYILIPKRWLYWSIVKVQTFYNGRSSLRYNNVMIDKDYLWPEQVEHQERMSFGPYEVNVPGQLERYLHHHYPTLKKDLSEEEKLYYYHRPKIMEFG